MLQRSVFKAYLDPGTPHCRWVGAEAVPGLAEEPDLRTGLSLITAAGWDVVSATARSVGAPGYLSSEYVLTCRSTSRPARDDHLERDDHPRELTGCPPTYSPSPEAPATSVAGWPADWSTTASPSV